MANSLLNHPFRLLVATIALMLVAALGVFGLDQPQWRDGNGRVAALEYQGADHCGWQGVRFLHVGPPNGTNYRQYVRDPLGAVGEADLLAEFGADVELPPDATATGITRGDLELWTVPTDEAIYVVGPEHVERWPRSARGFACV
jgi:hypothetical protein